MDTEVRAYHTCVYHTVFKTERITNGSELVPAVSQRPSIANIRGQRSPLFVGNFDSPLTVGMSTQHASTIIGFKSSARKSY